jgi:hypothetical protein
MELYFDEFMGSRRERTEDRFLTTEFMVMFTAFSIIKVHALSYHGISSSNEGQNMILLYHKTDTCWTF